jgi:uncharacterized membrane protein (DUF2068 family)
MNGKRRGAAAGLRMVALLEGAKGALVLLAGFGLLALVHRNLHLAAVELVRHFHVNPARHYPTVFIDLAGRITDTQLWSAAIAAMTYAAIRAVEAVGLWLQRRWAEWFGVLTGGMYLPIELYEVFREASWPRVTVLAVNAVVVLYLLRVLAAARKG